MSKKVGRRGWISGIMPATVDVVAQAQTVLEPEAPPKPRRRPPGAVDEETFLARCTGCGDCVTACPHDAIFTYVKTAGALASTPVMKPDKKSCHMCDGFPCAKACPEEALLPVATPTWWLGEVRISEEHCFTFRGPECGACAGVCPTETPALTMRGLHPSVEEEHCVGCGLCIAACPTIPKAIELLAYLPPIKEEPELQEASDDEPPENGQVDDAEDRPQPENAK